MNLPEKRCIYTVVTGGYDPVFAPLIDQPGWDMLYFTDDPCAKSDFWKICPLPELPEMENIKDNPAKIARMIKILPHRFLQDYDYSLYIDGNRILYGSADDYVKKHEADILCLGSPVADAYAAADMLLDIVPCTDYTELSPALPLSDEERAALIAQSEKWKKNGLPEWGGAPSTAVLGRFHNKANVIDVMESWAKEVLEYSSYDEPAFPNACHLHGQKWVEGLSIYVQPGDFYSPAEDFALKMPHAKLMLGENPPEIPVYPKNPPPPGGKYGGYPFVLSIILPVSNQIGTVRRCMEGIKPLLDNLPAELVVVDTGSTDGTVEVCQEFGARVVKFPWINDMSAARNTAIRNAKGMWFMSIDDDEWFEDVSEMIAFFKDPKLYEKFDGGQYVQYNYMDEFGVDAASSPARRMGKITPNIRFAGRIHDAVEYENHQNLYHFTTKAHHFGFQGSHVFALLEKSKRNISSLRYDMAQFPHNVRFSFQMIKEEIISKKVYPALACVFWSLSTCRQYLDKDYFLNCGGYGLSIFSKNPAPKQSIKFCNTFIDYSKYRVGDRCSILMFLAEEYRLNNMYDKALESIALYEKSQDEYQKLDDANKVMSNSLMGFATQGLSPLLMMQQKRQSIYLSLYKKEHLNEGLLQADLLEYATESRAHRLLIMHYIFETKNWGFAKDFFCALKTERGLDNVYLMYPEIDQYVKEEYRLTALDIFEQVGVPKTAIEPLFLLKNQTVKDESSQELIQNILDGLKAYVPETANYFKAVTLAEALRLGLDLSHIFATFTIADVDYTITYMSKIRSKNEEDAYKKLIEWQWEENPNAGNVEEYFRMQAGIMIYSRRQDELEFAEEIYKERFVKAIEHCWNWYEKLYKPSLLKSQDSTLFPRNAQAICLVRTALLQMDDGDKLNAMRNFKKALEVDSSLQEPVNLFVDEIMEELDRDTQKDKTAKTEFNLLLEGIKPKIEALIKAGLITEAKDLIAQLEGLAPNDPGLQSLKLQAGFVKPS